MTSDGTAAGSSPGRGVMADADEVSRQTGVPIRDDQLGSSVPVASRPEGLPENLTGTSTLRDAPPLPSDRDDQLDRIERKLDALLDHLGVEVDES